MPDWNSAQYLKFERERTQPAIDLANRIELENPRQIVDIGCGPGNSTAVLARRFPGVQILGIDNSPDMIGKARRDYPQLEFALCDAGRNLGGLDRDFDIVFSNACIQWIPEHRRLIPDMMGLLRPGGVLAVQAPDNFGEPVHKIIAEVTVSPEWASRFHSPRIFYNLAQGEYYDLLSELSADFSIWQTTYFHTMKSHSDILEWYRGTGLRPYLDILSPEDKPAFERDIHAELVRAYPTQKNGDIIFRFPRLFFTAVAPQA